MSASEIVNKVWNYSHFLRDDGVGYGDYVEQITYNIYNTELNLHGCKTYGLN